MSQVNRLTLQYVVFNTNEFRNLKLFTTKRGARSESTTAASETIIQEHVSVGV